MARLARSNTEQEQKKKSFLLPLLVIINLALTIFLYYKIGLL